jgi:hypothetical protein
LAIQGPTRWSDWKVANDYNCVEMKGMGRGIFVMLEGCVREDSVL